MSESQDGFFGVPLNPEHQQWSDEKLADEYLNKSRTFVSQLHSKELYTENPSWLRGDGEKMRIIVSPIVESYLQLLTECFQRRLAAPVYDECITMTENMLNGLSDLPGSDNATNFATIHYSLHKNGFFKGPSIGHVYHQNMNYLSWLWFHHQDKLDSKRPLAIISQQGQTGDSKMYACTLTFERGDFTYLSGWKEWSSIEKKWLKDSRIIEPYNNWYELSEMANKLWMIDSLDRDNNPIKFEFTPREAAADATRFPVVEGVVGVCPIHKADIIETETHYQPAEGSYGCSIQILREVSKREITREEAKTLIEKREIGPFGDFISKKTEREFSSKLYLKKNESIGYKFAKL